jgi:chorismate mutase/prephenate dehydratase
MYNPAKNLSKSDIRSRVPVKKFHLIGYVGSHTSLTFEATKKMADTFGLTNANLMPFRSVDTVLNGIARGSLSFGVLPLADNFVGINETVLEQIKGLKLEVITSTLLTTNLHLCTKAVNDTVFVKQIVAKLWQLNNCLTYVKAHLPHARLFSLSSAEEAALQVANSAAKEGMATICSIELAKHHGLIPLALNISDYPNPTLSFALIGKQIETPLAVPLDNSFTGSLNYGSIGGGDMGGGGLTNDLKQDCF